MRIETAILSNLISNEEYSRKVLPHLKKEYFQDRKETIVYSIISKFFDEYNKPASKEIISIELGNTRGISDKELSEYTDYVNHLVKDDTNIEWLVNETEKFCKDRAVYNAILESIKIIDGKNATLDQGAIPSILSDALSVSFDNSVGHDYLEDADSRYEFYHQQEERIPFNLDMFNKITGGGLPKKTLNICLAGTGVGKSLFMCHVAAGALSASKNVLYITMEMAEERIAERIDANILNLTMDELKTIDKESFNKRVNRIAKKSQGKLIVKEYPTAGAHSGHFRALLEELKIKKGFLPDIIFIDYLNICASQRMKQGGSVNSYTYVKSIAEELRGLAVEYNVPIVSATQTTRCLALDTLIIDQEGEYKEINSIKVGDKILSHSGFVEVTNIFPVTPQDVYEITTKSGKKIICSNKHIFPTDKGEKNILSGLSIGDFLFIKK